MLHHLDCLEALPHLPEGCVDMIFADLPYGTTQNKWDSIIPLDRLWPLLKRVCKGPMVFTAMQPFTSLLVSSNLKSFKYAMVWNKTQGTGFLNAKKQPMRVHEDLLVFYDEQPAYVPQMTQGHEPVHTVNASAAGTRSNNYGSANKGTSRGGSTERYPTSILNIPALGRRDKRRVHPTQKPIELPAWFIRTYTQPGDRLLDPCAGSNSTGKAALALGRKFIGFETDKEMFKCAT